MRQRAQLGFSLLAILAAGMTLSAAWPAGMPSTDADQDDENRHRNNREALLFCKSRAYAFYRGKYGVASKRP